MRKDRNSHRGEEFRLHMVPSPYRQRFMTILFEGETQGERRATVSQTTDIGGRGPDARRLEKNNAAEGRDFSGV